MEVMLGAISEAIAWTDEDGTVEWSNATFDRLVDRCQVNVLGAKLIELLPLQQQSQNVGAEAHPVNLALRGQINTTGCYEFLQTDRKLVLEITWTSIQLAPFGTSAVLVIRDITQRKRAEALAESEAKFRSLIQNSSDIITILEPDGTIKYESPSIEKILGYKPAEMIGKNAFKFIHPNDVLNVLNVFNQVLQNSDITLSVEYRFRHKDGSWCFLESTGSNLLNDPSVAGIVVNSRDITQRKQTEEALQESQQMLQLVMDNIPQSIFWKDRNSVYLGCNRNFAQAAGFSSPENIVGKTDYDLPWQKEETNWYRECDRRVIETGTAEYHIIETQLQAHGKQVWVDTNKVPLRNCGGNVVGILGTFEDITQRKQAEAALSESQRKLAALIDSLPGIVFSCANDPNWSVTFLSEGCFDVTGYTSEELVGNEKVSYNSITHVEDLPRVLDAINRAIAKHQPYVVEYRIHTKWGEEKWLWEKGIGIFNSNGEVLGLEGFITDTTQRKRAAEELIQTIKKLQEQITRRQRVEVSLRKSEQRYQNLYDCAPDMYFSVTADGTIASVNQFGADSLGYGKETLTGKSVWSIVYEEDQQQVQKQVAKIFSEKLARSELIFRKVRQDGSTLWVHERTQLILDEEHKPIELRIICRDITQRKRTEEKLAKRERYLSGLVEVQRRLLNSQDPANFYANVLEPLGQASGASRVYVFENYWDAAGRLFMSQRAEWRAEGIPSENNSPTLQNLPYEDFFPRWAKVLAQREIVTGLVAEFPETERLILEPQGILSILILPLNVNGKFFGFIGFDNCTEIRMWEASEVNLLSAAAAAISLALEHKRVEQALRKSEATNRALLAAVPDLMLRASKDGTYVDCVPANEFAPIVPIRELLGKKVYEVLPPEVAQPAMFYIEKALSTGEIQVFEYQLPNNGKIIDYEARVVVCAEDEVLIIVRDITERKQAEAAIDRERNQLRQIITNAPVAMAMFDTEMRYLTHSQKWLTLYDLEEQSLIGRSEYEVFPDIPEKWKLNHQRALKGEALSSSEDIWEREDGSKDYQRWALHPWYKPNGEVGGIVIAVERIKELVKAREAAFEASRLKSEFLATMSHELRTPLNAVIGMTGLLLNTELRSDQRGFVKIIRRSSDKLLTIINDILDFSKIESGKLELEQQPFDLQTCVEESLSLLASQAAEKSLKLAYSIAPPTPNTIIGDAARLGQILVNLLSNAVKFTETGEVMVSVTARKLGAREEGQEAREEEGISEGVEETDSSSSRLQPLASRLSLYPHPSPLAPRPYYEIQFAVKDTGIGIPQERMEKLFKSFSQVDSSISRRYGGTGLGLAICKQLAEIMGGRAWVESQVGQGSIFYFTLVAQASPIQLDTSEETIQAIPRLAEQLPLRILLAEDNRVNQQVALLTLEQLGYHADAVSNGLEVLQSLRRQPYHVVLMDIQMPEMDGLSTTRQIYQELPPDQRPRIIALTAYATEDNWKQCLEVGMDDYISKPIQITKLIRALSQCQPNKEDTGTPRHPDTGNFSASSSLAPLDAKVLQSLRKMTGARSTEVLSRLIDNYLEEAPQLLQAIRAAVVSKDAAALQQAAHTLRGTSATLGATNLSQLCKTLEAMGSTNITAGALASVLLVEAEYETVKSALQMECQRG